MTNLIQNPGFEIASATNVNQPANWWTYNSGAVVPTFTYPQPGRTGGSSAEIAFSSLGSLALYGQNVPLVGLDITKQYTLSGWINTSNMRGTGGANIQIDFYGNNNTTYISSLYSNAYLGTTWSQFTISSITIPSTADTARILCRLTNCTGNGWFDDLFFGIPTSGGGLPTPCQSANQPTIICDPNTPGTYPITVTVIDAANNTASATGTLTVNPALVVSLSANPATVNTGQSTTFTTNVIGGTTPFSYSWSGLPSGCAGANQASITCSPLVAGTYTVTVTVKDASGATKSATTTLTVIGIQPLSATMTIQPNPITLGQSVTFTVTVSGGTPPFNYQWS